MASRGPAPLADQGASASLDSLIALIDQIDLKAITQFIAVNFTPNDVHDSLLVPVFAFANWILTTLEGAAKVLENETNNCPRFQRQLAKREK